MLSGLPLSLLLLVRFSFVLRNVALSLGLAVALSVAAAASVNRDNNFLNWNWMKWFAYNIIYTMNANKLRRTARELAERAERQETWDLRRAFPFYLSDRLPGNSLTVAAASSPFPFSLLLVSSLVHQSLLLLLLLVPQLEAHWNLWEIFSAFLATVGKEISFASALHAAILTQL